MKVFKMNNSFLIRKDSQDHHFNNQHEASVFMHDQGVKWDEISLGFNEMLRLSHNTAHYGIGYRDGSPGFIFTEILSN